MQITRRQLGRRYSMTDDTGKGTELYLVRDENVVWSGSIAYLTIEGA